MVNMKNKILLIVSIFICSLIMSSGIYMSVTINDNQKSKIDTLESWMTIESKKKKIIRV